MQRRQFTQSLVAASTGLSLGNSSRAVGLRYGRQNGFGPGCSLGASADPLATLARELKRAWTRTLGVAKP